MEVLTVSRPSERLGQGMLLLVVGAALGLISWSVIGVPFVSLLLGGLPVLVAVYVLAGWAFPDGEGELRLYAQGHVITQPLRGSNAKRDSHLVAQRLYELMTGTSVPVPRPGLGRGYRRWADSRWRPGLQRRAGAASRGPSSGVGKGPSVVSSSSSGMVYPVSSSGMAVRRLRHLRRRAFTARPGRSAAAPDARPVKRARRAAMFPPARE